MKLHLAMESVQNDFPFGIFNKGKNKITELRTILQREGQNW
jgi:hypothetical protein